MPDPRQEAEVARVVAALACEAGAPESVVAALYEHVRAELAATARVVTFLHVFATRQVREILREQSAAAAGRAAKALLHRAGPAAK